MSNAYVSSDTRLQQFSIDRLTDDVRALRIFIRQVMHALPTDLKIKANEILERTA